MSAPVNTARVIRHVTKTNVLISNEELIRLAGGTDEQWGHYLRGPRAAAIVGLCNTELRCDGYVLSCEARGQGLWRLVTVHEGHLRDAEFNLDRVDGAYKRAHNCVEAIASDPHAPKRMRADATAWLQLFEEPRTERGLKIMREFATEMLVQTPKHHKQLKLVEMRK